MFLVILGSLAAAMAIMSQGNLATADSHLRINRSLAAAETGLRFMIFRLNQITTNINTTDGLIDDTNAPGLWTLTRQALLASLQGEVFHNLAEPTEVGTTLNVGPITLGQGQPSFTASFTPHPIGTENYNAAFYQRPPYSDQIPPVSMASPLDSTWIRVAVNASDGPVTRSIQMDFRIERKIKFAVLSKNRVMIGRNVIIDGPIGSRFMDVDLTNGHPVQMVSDFRGLNSSLDADLDMLTDALEQIVVGSVTIGDMDGDNRLNLADPAEYAAMANPEFEDLNDDGYIDEYDYFLKSFDDDGNGQISKTELDVSNNVTTRQLLELIDTFGDPNRPGYGDDVIDNYDRYVKLNGEVSITANLQNWLDGASGGRYQDFFQGPIRPDHGKAPLTFDALDTDVSSFGSSSFDVSSFRQTVDDYGDTLENQATPQAASNPGLDPSLPLMDVSGTHREEVPYGAAHPYDFYDRPVYENMTFTNVIIPEGTNALFSNCTFIGVTFVETAENNDDPDFNFAGIIEADGTLKYPSLVANVDGNDLTNTKSVSNNIRFHSCTFEGAVIGEPPKSFTHVRNKIAFTGNTNFDVDGSPTLSDEQKSLYKRSAILTPHYSVEIGSFLDPSSANEKVYLSGTIVAGVLDIRGQAEINGTLLTTFEPQRNVAPVVGDTTPQFNTTLGYFPSSAGDLEAELPPEGAGMIQIRYDPTLGLPDGINGPIDITPITSTYVEGHSY